MDPYAAKLAAFLAARRIAAEQRRFAVSTHTVAEAAAAAGASAADFVKSICFVEKEAEPFLAVAVVRGEDRASASRVGALVGSSLRLATPEEMLARTGYPAGGTPPFGFEARFLVDERVMERAFVWAGGGSDRSLVRVDPREMVRANGGTVARVRR